MLVPRLGFGRLLNPTPIFFIIFSHQYLHTWAWVLATEGGPAWRLDQGGSPEGGLFSKNLIHRGGSGILKISEGGLYISPCKTPILFIVLPQF